MGRDCWCASVKLAAHSASAVTSDALGLPQPGLPHLGLPQPGLPHLGLPQPWLPHNHRFVAASVCLYVHAFGSFVRVAAWPSPFPKGAKRSTRRGGHDHQARTRRKRLCHLTPSTLKPRAQTNQRFNVRHLQVQVPLLVIANNDDTRSGARRPPRGHHCVRRRVQELQAPRNGSARAVEPTKLNAILRGKHFAL